MKKIMLALLIAILPQLLMAQFPGNFLGEWKGTLQWIVPGKPTQEFAMSLKVAKHDSLDVYTWLITYGTADGDCPYTLKPVNKERNHWAIDEHNGIILEYYVAGNCLQGAFTVMNNTIINNYCVESGKLRVEFFTVKQADKTTTGKGTQESPVVDSYRMAGYQYGLLEKVR